MTKKETCEIDDYIDSIVLFARYGPICNFRIGYWPRSELLGMGDDPVPHWAKVMMAAAAHVTFQYPAGHARAGQLDAYKSATGVFKSWLMTTVESDLIADTMSLMGPSNSEEEKLNGAEFRVPDDLPLHWVTFESATALQ